MHFEPTESVKTLADYDVVKNQKWINDDATVDQKFNQKLIDKFIYPLNEQLNLEVALVVDLCYCYFKTN